MLGPIPTLNYANPDQRVNFGPVLNAHPITQDLCALSYFNEGGGVNVTDLKTGRIGVLGGTSLPTWKNQYLNFTNASGGVPGVNFGVHPLTADLAQGKFTVVARFAPDQSFSTSGGVAYRNDGNAAGAQGWQVVLTTGGMLLTIERSTTNFSARTTAVISTTPGRWTTVATVYFGDLTAANTLLYYDGVPQTHSSDTNGVGTQGSDASQSLILGAANFTNNSLNGSIARGWFHWIGVWRRVLTQNEILMLTADPHLMLRQPPASIWSPNTTPFVANFPALTVAW